MQNHEINAKANAKYESQNKALRKRIVQKQKPTQSAKEKSNS